MSRPLILGLSASLRNARSRKGSQSLAVDIAGLETREELDAFLAEQANIHLEQFKEAGRNDGKPFDELYRNLKKQGGQRGLSNSEIALTAALWGAVQKGASVSHLSLSEFFPADGQPKNLDDLKAALREADGILLSTPVYFGDRSSLTQQFVDLIRNDDSLKEELRGKLYAGVSVGAKRNGGQETTLIYAMMDMLALGFLGVGNDSQTTSQYGGTGHAGDIGTMPKDTYGIDTSIGAGRRIGSVAVQLLAAESNRIGDLPNMDFWVMQDRDGEMAGRIAPFIKANEQRAATRMFDFTEYNIRPCIACDICPTHVATDSEYRCIIKRRDDGFMVMHNDLRKPDVIVPSIYSPVDRAGLKSVYQEFMERTRYLRRGDYVFTDHLVQPLIVSEVGSKEFMDIRLMTSFVRHHTVLIDPIVAIVHKGELLNADEVTAGLERSAMEGARLTSGRLASANLDILATQYQPVGYVLASAADKEAAAIAAREDAVEDRLRCTAEEAKRRLETTDAMSKVSAV